MIQFKVLSKVKDEELSGATYTLTLGFPDENGQILTLTPPAATDLDAVIEGGLYTMAAVPMVTADHPDAVASTAASTPATPVPVDHPLVICAEDASASASPDPATVIVAPPAVPQLVTAVNPTDGGTATSTPPADSTSPSPTSTTSDSTPTATPASACGQ